MNKQQLIEKFVSNKSFDTIWSRANFKALTDEEFAIITSLGADEGQIHVTASAAKYIEQRKSGTLPVPFDDGNQPQKDSSFETLGIDKAWSR